MSTTAPIPTGPVTSEPGGYHSSQADQRAALLDALSAAGLKLGKYDQRIADWVAGLDWGTAATIASWAKRAAAGGDNGAGAPDSRR